MDRMILSYITQHAWLIEEQTLNKLVSVVNRHAMGVKLEAEEITQIAAAAPSRSGGGDRGYEVIDGVAIIPIDGILAKHSYMINGMSQPRGTSTLSVRHAVEAAANDAGVSAILLDVYSPGGSVEGVAEAADAVYEAAKRKPVWAQANDLMASGAYYIASQAEKVFTTAMGLVGSIGAYTVLTDSSKAAENMGLKVHVVKAGEFKAGGVPGAPIDENHLSAAQQVINDISSLFVNAVARGRGVSAEAAKEWADGRVHVGQAAVKLGLADGVQSIETTLAQLTTESRRRPSTNRSSAMARKNPRTAPVASITAPQIEGEQPPVDDEEDPEAPEETATTPAPAPSAADPVKAERERCAAITAEFKGDADFTAKAIAEGMSITEAKAAHYDANKNKAPAPTMTPKAPRGVEPLATATSGAEGSGDGSAEATCMELIAKHQKALPENMNADTKRIRAVANARKENPTAFENWTAEKQAAAGRS